mmetsp:Transcript_44831/g.97390  ORF Transcript_44831/g.97390 Transcript_44831/m.97390 type:complete len:205 (-) Transcript_44831:373-987(-)
MVPFSFAFAFTLNVVILIVQVVAIIITGIGVIILVVVLSGLGDLGGFGDLCDGLRRRCPRHHPGVWTKRFSGAPGAETGHELRCCRVESGSGEPSCGVLHVLLVTWSPVARHRLLSRRSCLLHLQDGQHVFIMYEVIEIDLLHWISRTRWHLQHRAIPEVGSEGGHIQGGTHEDDANVSSADKQLLEQNEKEVSHEVPLVDLIH